MVRPDMKRMPAQKGRFADIANSPQINTITQSKAGTGQRGSDFEGGGLEMTHTQVPKIASNVRAIPMVN